MKDFTWDWPPPDAQNARPRGGLRPGEQAPERPLGRGTRAGV